MNDRSTHWRRNVVAAAVGILIALSGCTSTTDTPSDSEGNNPSETSSPTPCEGPCGSHDEGIPGPSWEVGQWWEWTVTYRDTSFPVKTTVNAIEGGMAHHASADLEDGLAAVWFHLPPLGQVDTSDLSWVIHDDFNSLLQFPLVDNSTWTGMLEGSEIQMTSTRMEEGLYLIEGVYENGGPAVRVEYDAQAEMYSSIELLYGGSEPWSTATLTGFGQGERLSSYVPVYHDLVIGWAATPSGPIVAESFHVATDIDYVVVGCTTGGGPGVFSVVLEAPLTEPHDCPRAGPFFAQEHNVFDFIILEGVQGEWNYEIMGTAEGFVSTEILAVSITES